MTHPGLAVMLVVGVGLGAVLYYFFASTPEQVGQSNRRPRNSNNRQESSNRTYWPSSTPSDQRNRRQDHYCMICLEDTNTGVFERAVRIVSCMHVFHKQCIEQWRINGAGDARQLCPICRDKIVDLEEF